MENKTVRFVKKLGLRTRINYPVFSDVGILNIENRVQQLRFNHVHTIFYDKGPKYMGQNFSKARDLHHHSTRGKHYNSVVSNVNGMTSTTFYFFKDWNSPVSNST
jgi:predicted ATPase